MNNSIGSIGTKKLQMADLIFREVSDAIMITDAAGRIIDANPAFTRLLEFGRVELLGQTPECFMADDHSGSRFETLCSQLSENGQWSGSVDVRKKSGEPCNVILTLIGVKDVEGEMTHFITIMAAASFMLLK